MNKQEYSMEPSTQINSSTTKLTHVINYPKTEQVWGSQNPNGYGHKSR